MSRPLEGMHVVVTRPEGPDGPLSDLLEARGASVLYWPTLRIESPEDIEPLRNAMERLEGFDWIVFSSARAVRAIVPLCSEAPDGPRVAAVGDATAESLEEAGWPVHVTAQPGSADALVEEFGRIGCAGHRILFPASSIARATIPAGLRALGAQVERVEAYRTVPVELDRDACMMRVASGEISAVTFASPSAVEGLRHALGSESFDRLLGSTPSVAIGLTTSRALDEAGHPAAAVAASSSLEGLVQAVENVVLRTRSH